MRLLLIISLLIVNLSAFSAEAIKEGSPAPYDGVIFNSKESRELVAKDKKLIKLEQLNPLYEEKIEIQDKRITLLKDHVENTQNLSTFSKTVWFALGFLSGSVMFYYAGKAMNN